MEFEFMTINTPLPPCMPLPIAALRLPISSTGHMLLVDEFLQLNASDSFKEMFFIIIQLGAILAVVVLYWNRMFPFQFKDKAKPVIRKDIFLYGLSSGSMYSGSGCHNII